ncbi:bifunctional adenosylcobinamide kinase/adenosylcobinamide-phosphate guanylyltransferase [Croceicoccus mobilis]|uniref:Bifunctional adenosylcobalamin biosynthesis protein n=1 Tax=Croceicoccus mobilis TaxID=1703339 RepID=A0A916Z8L3_9SPHN|nr:bifunctional adenosylcobinamide kinase/adenosylcobinamide-phosphate guanylyltransferase [Croceicoccus mobilis]GGD81576.1 adenosylcobinamide kinase/adenosylcobinamide phosphate guanyltransferase [Croceicoccus mobilis]
MSTLLVLGGARSGKSRFAENWVAAQGTCFAYIATAQALDEEMAQRIERHRADRGDAWQTLEAPMDLAGSIADAGGNSDAILVDCLTLWLSNWILAEKHPPVSELVEAVIVCPRPIALVANEVGLGIVPDNALARRFRDEAGRLNQAVAAAVEQVVLMVAGLPVEVKN